MFVCCSAFIILYYTKYPGIVVNACVQRKERAEQVAYKLEQDLALCKYVANYTAD